MKNEKEKEATQERGTSALTRLLGNQGDGLKVLNLYAGLGGNRKLWENVDVTAVEIDEDVASVYRDNFPTDEVIIGDAHEYLLKHYREYDFIWSSPPCPTHSKIRLCGTFRGQNEAVYPDMKLYQEVVFLKYHATDDQKWIVENVHPYYKPLVPYTKKIDRHVYWTNFKLANFDLPLKYDEVRNSIDKLEGVVGIRVRDSDIKNKLKALRNCVHPEIGKHVFDRVTDIFNNKPKDQGALFA